MENFIFCAVWLYEMRKFRREASALITQKLLKENTKVYCLTAVRKI